MLTWTLSYFPPQLQVDGTLPKGEVFSQIDSILSELRTKKEAALGSLAA